jgi:hypothetical protein
MSAGYAFVSMRITLQWEILILLVGFSPMRVSSTAISPDPHGLILSGSVATQTLKSIRLFDRN